MGVGGKPAFCNPPGMTSGHAARSTSRQGVGKRLMRALIHRKALRKGTVLAPLQILRFFHQIKSDSYIFISYQKVIYSINIKYEITIYLLA
jgi:hypothetical protein